LREGEKRVFNQKTDLFIASIGEKFIVFQAGPDLGDLKAYIPRSGTCNNAE
jgi:hypothetical protein